MDGDDQEEEQGEVEGRRAKDETEDAPVAPLALGRGEALAAAGGKPHPSCLRERHPEIRRHSIRHGRVTLPQSP